METEIWRGRWRQKCESEIAEARSGFMHSSRWLSIPLLMLFALFAITVLVGCEGSAATTEPTLEAADISGHWVVDGSGSSNLDEMLKIGMMTELQFDEDGNFKLVAHLEDAKLERVGTYRIEGERVYVNVPEMEKQSSGSLSLSGKAIEDGEIVIDGDTLTSTVITSDGSETVAKKVTDEQYQAYVDQIVALAPKKVALGATVTADLVTFTVGSLSYADEVRPSDTSGYYTYLPHQDGKSYLVATVAFSNNSTEYMVPGYSTQASFSVGDNQYSGTIVVDVGPRSGQSYRVEAKETTQMCIYCLVPDAVMNSGAIKMTWSIPTEQTYMSTYFKSSFPHVEYVFTA